MVFWNAIILNLSLLICVLCGVIFLHQRLLMLYLISFAIDCALSKENKDIKFSTALGRPNYIPWMTDFLGGKIFHWQEKVN